VLNCIEQVWLTGQSASVKQLAPPVQVLIWTALMHRSRVVSAHVKSRMSPSGKGLPLFSVTQTAKLTLPSLSVS
jgi:hypothetical protein